MGVAGKSTTARSMQECRFHESAPLFVVKSLLLAKGGKTKTATIGQYLPT